MSVWAVMRNIGTIISLFKALSSLIGGVASQKKMPAPQEIKVVIDHIQTLLESGAIDIPNVDEKAISEALQQIEDQLMK